MCVVLIWPAWCECSTGCLCKRVCLCVLHIAVASFDWMCTFKAKWKWKNRRRRSIIFIVAVGDSISVSVFQEWNKCELVLLELRAVLHSMNEFRRGYFSINIVIASVFCSSRTCTIAACVVRLGEHECCACGRCLSIKSRETSNQHLSRALLKGSAACFFLSLSTASNMFFEYIRKIIMEIWIWNCFSGSMVSS